MGEILPVDLPNLFLAEIEKQRRPPDGLLHPSGDLLGSLRHSQLRAAGAPARQRPIAQDIRLMHGTIWHNWFHSILESNGIRHENEVPLSKWMPNGWSGTADWIFWHPEYEAWVLGDLKTTKGESMFFLNKGGMKDEHLWQLSAYFWALVDSGRPMVDGFGVMYWPMNDTNDTVDITPLVIEAQPVPREVIYPVMEARWEATRLYLNDQEMYQTDFTEGEYLAPEQERVQKIIWNKGQKVWDVKLVPHWSAAFCDYPDYCDCSTRGTTKIGHYRPHFDEEWDRWGYKYEPRTGYENEIPESAPGVYELNKRKVEYADQDE